MASFEFLRHFFKTSYEGIDFKLAGNGGFECYDYLSTQNRVFDTCVFIGLVFILIIPRVLRTLSLPKEWEVMSYCRNRSAQRICGFRKVLLIVLSIILGIEIGYKISEKSWIFLLNPCHVISAIQVFLLVMYSAIQVFCFSGIPILRYSAIQVFRFSGIPLLSICNAGIPRIASLLRD